MCILDSQPPWFQIGFSISFNDFAFFLAIVSFGFWKYHMNTSPHSNVINIYGHSLYTCALYASWSPFMVLQHGSCRTVALRSLKVGMGDQGPIGMVRVEYQLYITHIFSIDSIWLYSEPDFMFSPWAKTAFCMCKIPCVALIHVTYTIDFNRLQCMYRRAKAGKNVPRFQQQVEFQCICSEDWKYLYFTFVHVHVWMLTI